MYWPKGLLDRGPRGDELDLFVSVAARCAHFLMNLRPQRAITFRAAFGFPFRLVESHMIGQRLT